MTAEAIPPARAQAPSDAADEPRPTRARARIYRAALRVFAESGGVDISISELAEAAGIARGTIYNNIPDPENLFGDVAAALAQEMIQRTEITMQGRADPVDRIATGMRLFVRRAHEDRDWGLFLVRFALSHAVLHGMMHEPPVQDVRRAIAAKRFTASPAQAPALVAMLSGTVLAAMNAALRGDQTWRNAGSDAAELFLRAGGVTPAEAHTIARSPLPDLAPAVSRPRKRAST